MDFEVCCDIYFTDIIVSPGQKRGSCGHMMAAFDLDKKCM